jgi:hypothetical protein
MRLGLKETGTISLATATITASDSGIDVIELPANSLIIRTAVEIIDPFAGAMLSVGTDDTASNLLAPEDIDGTKPGFNEKATPVEIRIQKETVAKARWNGTPTAGTAVVYVKYVKVAN